MAAWLDAAMAASLLLAAVLRARHEASPSARASRRAVCIALVALAVGSLLHATITAGSLAGMLPDLVALWLADLAAMAAAAALAGTVAATGPRSNGRASDWWTTSLYGWGMATAALIMAAQMIVLQARHGRPSVDSASGDGVSPEAASVAYVAPFVAFLLVAAAVTVHGLARRDGVTRATQPAALAAVLGGAWCALAGIVWQRLHTFSVRDPVEAMPDLTHPAVQLEYGGCVAVIVGLLAPAIWRGYWARWRTNAHRGLEPFWRLTTEVLTTAGDPPRIAAPHGDDPLYDRVIQIQDACLRLQQYLPEHHPDPLGMRWPAHEHDQHRRAAADLWTAMAAVQAHADPDIAATPPPPPVDEDDPEALARWQLAVWSALDTMPPLTLPPVSATIPKDHSIRPVDPHSDPRKPRR